MSDLGKRLPTTVVLIAFAYSAIRFLPTLAFAVVLYAICIGAVIELCRLTRPAVSSWLLLAFNGALISASFVTSAVPLSVAISAIIIVSGCFFLFAVRTKENIPLFVRDFGIQLLAVFYLFFPLFFLLELKKISPNALFFLIAVIAIGDSGAYFIGSSWGKHKIYPLASPKKSLEGLIAAVATAALAGWLSIVVFPLSVKPYAAIACGAVIGLFSQLSDPVESLFKRAAGSKDSGTLLPGHGGILDRVDSYIFCAPLLYLICHYLWKL